MLRNTSDGNELALPATNTYPRSIVSVTGTVRLAAHALVCRGPRHVAALASDSLVGGPGHKHSTAKHSGAVLPFGGYAGTFPSFARKQYVVFS